MSGEIFDPEIHAADKDGNPSLNKDGSFRKKRRDAGQSTTRTRSKSSSAGAAKATTDQRSRYVKAVSDTLVIPATLLSVVDPVDGFCAQQLTPMWADALADLAMEQPRLAAVLERAAGVGAVGGVLTLGLLTAVQFAHNHGRVPAQFARMVGGTPREEIETMLQQRGEQMARQSQQQAAQDAEDARMSAEYATRDAQRAAA